MKENKYDDPEFYREYSRMDRSVKGLEGAGEWYILRTMLPDFRGKRVLDLGCGFGWHCRYAAAQGASYVLGIDISQKMLAEATRKNTFPQVEYRCMPIEDITGVPGSFDIVLSSLAFHYLESFDAVAGKVSDLLSEKGWFVFSVEHPVFTAYGNQDWIYDEKGERLHWPVDNYYHEGRRTASFLGKEVTKYHKTLTTYVNGLLKNGFELLELVEAAPGRDALETIPGMADEMRRPMMLLLKARKR